jgi:hypothetical protein
MTTFEKELEGLINAHSKENESNTPDYILAQYICSCLAAFNVAVQHRENWYGRDRCQFFTGANLTSVAPDTIEGDGNGIVLEGFEGVEWQIGKDT